MLTDVDVRWITENGSECHAVSDITGLLTRPAGFVWVDIPHCDDEAVRVLAEVFGFHPLAVKDCVERNRVPKMHAYPDCVFVVLHAPETGERGHVHYLELDQFRARHGLLAVRTMAALSAAIYGRMTSLAGLPDHGKTLVADTADQFTRVRRIADGEREYLQGVIEFYQSILTVKATIVGQTQNDKLQQLTEASYAQNEEIKRISARAAIFKRGRECGCGEEPSPLRV
jgi:Mg2+ and Co2+ transporter CorA